MTWVFLDDNMPAHPKILKAGNEVFALQCAGLCYCNKYLTDGFIPEKAVRSLLPDPLAPDTVQRICDCGIWEPTDGGYQVHDYLDYQRSRAEVLERREKARESGRQGGIAKASKTPSERLANARANAIAVASGLLDPPAYSHSHSPPTPNPTPNPSPPIPCPTQGKDQGGEQDPDFPSAKPERSLRERKKPGEGEKAVSKSGETWEAYKGAYERRYGVPPIRNAKMNSLLSKLVDFLGADIAPLVAASYFESSDALYVRSKHCPDLLLRDAQRLHTEMQTGRRGTFAEAKEKDRQSKTGDSFRRVIERLEAEEEEKQCQKPTSPKLLQ